MLCWFSSFTDRWREPLSPQPQSITAVWPVPSYTAWWQRHIGVNNLPKVVTQRCLEQDFNPRPTDRKPKCLTCCTISPGINGTGILWTGCASCQPTNSVRALKETQSIDHNHGFFLTSSTTSHHSCLDVGCLIQVRESLFIAHAACVKLLFATCVRVWLCENSFGCISTSQSAARLKVREYACVALVLWFVGHSHCIADLMSQFTGRPQTWKTWYTQGFLWTWKTHRIPREFCVTSAKNDFALWVQPVSSNPYAAKCIWCTKTVDLSSMGRQALVSHMSSSWCGMTLDIRRSLLRILFVAMTPGKV